MLKLFWAWWASPSGILSWVEANQGLVSALSIGAAWWMAVRQQKTALDAEARSNERARLAKEEGIREVREAEIDRRIFSATEFATTANGVIADAERVLENGYAEMKRPFSARPNQYIPTDTAISMKAATLTLNALLTTSPRSPLLIRAVFDAIADLHCLEPYTFENGIWMTEEQCHQHFNSLIQRLADRKMQIQDAELDHRHRLRPQAPMAAPTSHRHF